MIIFRFNNFIMFMRYIYFTFLLILSGKFIIIIIVKRLVGELRPQQGLFYLAKKYRTKGNVEIVYVCSLEHLGLGTARMK